MWEKFKVFWNKGGKWGALALAGVLLFLAGLGTGRYGLPDKVLIQEKVKEVVQEKVVIQEKVRVEKIYLKDQKQKIHREITEKKHPDGTQEKKVSEDINIDTVVRENQVEVKFVDRWQDRIVEKIVEKEKLVLNKKAEWRLGADVGVSIPVLLGGQEQGIVGLRGAVVGVHAERRIIGPFWMGVWGNTQGTAGVKLDIEF
jgi:hypothetical protein